jgi:hypothetical protein
VKKRFWSALCDITGSLSKIFEQLAEYALGKYYLAMTNDLMEDCYRCAGTGVVGQVLVNEGTLSEKWMPGDWAFPDNPIGCPDCHGTGVKE